MKHHTRLALLLTLVLAMLLLSGCQSAQEAPEAATQAALQVTVSIVPQMFFVERLGGELVDVAVMVQPGNSPATYEPKAAQLEALSRSDAYFSIGVPFERAWLERIQAANPAMPVVDTSQGITLREIDAHHHEGEEEEEEEHHDEAVQLDPHIWLSPALVRTQAQTIAATLIAEDPEHREVYEANLAAFDEELTALENDIRGALSGITSRRFLVFHPTWGYFADEFGLEQMAIEVDGQEPSAKELAEIIEEAQENGIQVVLAQPEFSTRAAETIAKELDGKVIKVSPLAENWDENLRTVAATFAEVLGAPAAE